MSTRFREGIRLLWFVLVMGLWLVNASPTMAVPGEGSRWDRLKAKLTKSERLKRGVDEGWQPSPNDLAYFLDDEGLPYPVLDPVDRNDEEDWQQIRYTRPREDEVKLRVALMEPVDRRRNPENYRLPNGTIGDLAIDALYDTQRFVVAERARLHQILEEQEITQTELFAAPTAVKLGRIQGTSFLIFPMINEWIPDKKTYKGRLSRSRLGLDGGKTISEVVMTFRVVDAISGLVVYTESVRANSEAWRLGVRASSGGTSGGTEITQQDPITYALTACIQKAIYRLALWLQDQPWTGSVAGVERGGRILINAGRNLNLQMGMKMAVLKNMGEIVDPNTKLTLGIRAETIGNIELMTVDDAYSVGMITQGCKGVKVGDRVKFVRSSRGASTDINR